MRMTLVLLVVLLMCTGVHAGPPQPKPIGDVVMQFWGTQDRGNPTIYDNLETEFVPAYFLPQSETQVPYGDDLHLTTGGSMDTFSFAYFDPEGGDALSQVVVHFYADDPTHATFPGGEPGSTLLKSYVISDLPGDGGHVFTADVSGDPITLPENVWIEFDLSDSPEAGLVLYNPPSVGTSDDLFEVHGDDIFVLGYPYVANFGVAITAGEEQPQCPGDLI